MPDLIADAFDCVGENMNDWLDLEPVSPLYRAYYHDGSQLDVHANPQRMAQEIEEVLPEVVITRDNGYKAVKYEKIVPLLIQCIKELKDEIRDLKSQN
jgi:hypothetical protein